MDGSRFDRLVRAMVAGRSRRHLLHGLGGAGLTVLLGHTRAEDASAACVKPGKQGCRGPRNRTCCRGATCQGGGREKEGRCTCKGTLKQCGGRCVNTKTDEKNCGGCNKKCQGTNRCDGGFCVSKLGCRAGQNACDEPLITDPDDPRICGGDGETTLCLCATDLNGVARCSDIAGAFCSACTRDANCPTGFVCIDGTGVGCECDQVAGSSGNLCIRADCDGLGGSSTGRTRTALKTPLLDSRLTAALGPD